jgi:ABC-type phosphate/phosphonate transport system substrate-binding protein
MLASLPMYDRPENAAAHDAFWALVRDRLRARGIAAPDALDRATHHMDGWARPDLVLGQICNLPYRAQFRDRVTVIGAADYGLPDTPPGHYHSVFVVRADDPARSPQECAGYAMAFNEGLSQSGWGAPSDWAAAHGLTLHPRLHTGGHVASLQAVATGQADLAAIDAISFRNFLRWVPAARAVRVIGRTHSSPGMTFITAPGRDPAPFRAAIAGAITALDDAARDLMGLRAIVTLPPADYDIPLPRPPHLPENPAPDPA